MAAARQAIDALEQAGAAVTRHFGDTVDARRLRLDLVRVRDDLTLLCGARPARVHEPFGAVYYDDGYDQGMDAPGRTAP